MKVDFEDRKYWKTQKCNKLIKPADFLAKSTSDVLCNFVFIFHWDDGVISMNFYPFWAVFQIWPGMKYWSNWVEIQWIYSQFNRSNSTGHEILLNLGWNSWIYSQFMPGRIGYHPNEFTPILSSISYPVEFDRAWNIAKNGSNFIGMIPNSTRQADN